MSNNRLLVVGPSRDFDTVHARVSQGTRTVSVRCDRPDQLATTLANARRERFGNQLIDVLDIHDHSFNNGMALGSEILFDVDDSFSLVGAGVAGALRRHLSDTAHLRLLGCDVIYESDYGAPPSSAQLLPRRCLLVWLADLLGRERIVSGTNLVLNSDSFDEDGLRAGIARKGLFSSLAAIHGDPCSFSEQGRRIARLLSLKQTPEADTSFVQGTSQTDTEVTRDIGSGVAPLNAMVASCKCVAPVATQDDP
jgi:hypothetical protein